MGLESSLTELNNDGFGAHGIVHPWFSAHGIACNGAYKRLGGLHFNVGLDVRKVKVHLAGLARVFSKANEISIGWVFPRVWVFSRSNICLIIPLGN